jgi:S1-C subfamily serine protease
MKRIVLNSVFLAAGIAAGAVIAGKLAPSNSFATQTPSTPRASSPAVAAASQGLPDLSTIAEQAVKASANISSTQVIQQRSDPFAEFFGMSRGGRYTEREAQSLGSGVIVSSDGYIVTNAHVLIGNGGQIRDVKVTLPAWQSELPAKIIGLDTVSDLALLKVDAKDLPTLQWGDSDKVRIAEWVLAIGNPFQFNQTVTLGIVSAKGRAGAQMGAYGEMIQTDAAINPGNSGGALVNSRGELIGINSMIFSRTGGSEGLGFAIPAKLAQRIIKELRENGQIAWGNIADISVDDVAVNQNVARDFGITSPSVIFVDGVAPSSAAARAGLRARDVILAFNGTPVPTVNDLQRLVRDARIGSTATLSILRSRDRIQISVPITSTAK